MLEKPSLTWSSVVHNELMVALGSRWLHFQIKKTWNAFWGGLTEYILPVHNTLQIFNVGLISKTVEKQQDPCWCDILFRGVSTLDPWPAPSSFGHTTCPEAITFILLTRLLPPRTTKQVPKNCTMIFPFRAPANAAQIVSSYWDNYNAPLNEPTDTVGEIGTNKVSRRSLQTLTNGQWLNDEIINFVLARAVADHNAKQPRRKCAVFSSFFVATLLQEDHVNPDIRGEVNYDRVEGWATNIAPDGDLFKLDKLFIPVNLNKNHWVLVVVDFQASTISCHDSLGERQEKLVQDIHFYLLLQEAKVHGYHRPHRRWLTISKAPTPIQNNGHDCGIFCCLVAFHTLIEGRPLIELGQDFVDYARTWFAYFILSSMYFWDFTWFQFSYQGSHHGSVFLSVVEWVKRCYTIQLLCMRCGGINNQQSYQ